jgi:hypothetical protein
MLASSHPFLAVLPLYLVSSLRVVMSTQSAGDSGRSSRRFLHDVLDRLYSEQQDAVLSYNEEIEALNKEVSEPDLGDSACACRLCACHLAMRPACFASAPPASPG